VSHHQARAGLHANLAGELGDAEVEHRHVLSAEHLGVRGQEQVVGLGIAVRDASRVRRR
jgi:hypothetical protein